MLKTKVLIVGAGPTGLMMASQLAIRNIPFIIVEKDSGPTTQSRALGIQARSIEIFSQMGISDIFLQQGEIATGANFISEGKKLARIPLSDFGKGLSPFPYLLILEQEKTEKILVDFLKKHQQKILWDAQVISFTQDKERVLATIKTKNEKEEIHADWIIGADGAHSIVRHALGIHLVGKTYKQSLFVLDCKISSSLTKKEIAVVFSKKAFAAFFPMTNNRWRVVGEIPDKLQKKDDITFEDVEKDFGKRLNLDIKLSDPSWISLYHSHHRCVEKFREGRAFLLGDAAHIHSPVGAQGMNTGLQDAYNLAWKLAFIYENKAKPKILDTYNLERLPFARKLVETTDRVFNLAIARNTIEVLFRVYVLPILLKIAVTSNITHDFAFRTISQIGISYHSSPLSKDASFGKFPKNAPQPGDRLPYTFLQKEKVKINIQDLIKPEKMTLFIFSSKSEEEENLKNTLKTYEKMISIITVPNNFENKVLYKKFGIQKSGYYLVRPDVYIAYRSNSMKSSSLLSYLSRFFIEG